MRIEIKIEGPAASGKTFLGDELASFLKEKMIPLGKSRVIILTTNAIRPEGVDTRPWNKEHDFNV